MSNMEEHAPAPSRPRSCSRAIFIAAGLYVFIINFPVLSPVLLTFLLTLLLTLALNPVVVALRGLIRGRGLRTALVALFFLIFLAVAGWAFFRPVSKSIGHFTHELPIYWQRIKQPLQQIQHGLNSTRPGGGPLSIDGSQFFSAISQAAKTLLANTAEMMAVALTVFVGVIYTLVNPRPVFHAFLGLVPDRHQAKAWRVAREIAAFVPQWALAMVIGMLTIGVLVFIAMWFVLGFQDALALALIAFAFETIPYVGAVLAGIPALLLGFGVGGLTPLWVTISYVTIQLLEHNVINPVVIAGRLKQHPLAVIFSVAFCILLFGILGVLLAVPMVATLQILYDELYYPRFLPRTPKARLDQLSREIANTHFSYRQRRNSDPSVHEIR